MRTRPKRERHHIIPYELREHPAFQRSGLNINAAHNNMTYLPRFSSKGSPKTTHSFFHIGDMHHNDYVNNQLDIIYNHSGTQKEIQKKLWTYKSSCAVNLI